MTTTIPTRTKAPAIDIGNDGVIFDEVGRNQWRVLDARVANESAAAIVGFVCRVAGLYEVTTLASPLEVSFHADLQASRAIFTDLP